MNDFLQDVMEIRLSNKIPNRMVKKQTKISSTEFADGKEVAQDFGKEEHQGKPASDPQTFDKAKGEFADGDEVVNKDFKASAKEEFVVIDEDGKVFSNMPHARTGFIDTVDDPDGGYSKAVKMTKEQADNFVKKNPDCEVLSVQDAFEFVKSSADVRIADDELVLMDGDGKILSTTEDGKVEFLDTVDDPDGGYSKAVKFNSYREAHEALWKKYGEDIPEDIFTIKAKDAFSFVE